MFRFTDLSYPKHEQLSIQVDKFDSHDFKKNYMWLSLKIYVIPMRFWTNTTLYTNYTQNT